MISVVKISSKRLVNNSSKISNVTVEYAFKSEVFKQIVNFLLCYFRGWSGGAMMLGKFPVAGRPTNLDNSRASLQ